MSRQLFGAWGLALPRDDFARAVAALAWLGTKVPLQDGPEFERRARRLRGSRGGMLPVSTARVAGALVSTSRRGAVLPPASTYVRCWKQLLDGWSSAIRGPRATPLRVEIRDEVPRAWAEFAPDAPWLVEQLWRAGAEGAYLRQDEPDRPVAWEWPLRIGVLSDEREALVRAALAQSPFPELFEVVSPRRGERATLLMIPYSLQRAAARLLDRPRRIVADCVVVLGGSKSSPAATVELLRALRREADTSAVALVGIDSGLMATWFTRLLIELSHDAPLDVALLAAHARSGAEAASPPLLVASAHFAREARATSFARRLVTGIERHVATAADVEVSAIEAEGGFVAKKTGDGAPGAFGPGFGMPVAAQGSTPLQPLIQSLNDVKSLLATGLWDSERGDATRLVRARRAAESMVQAKMIVPHAFPGGAAPTIVEFKSAKPPSSKAAAAQQRSETRRVSCSLEDVTDPATAHAVDDGLRGERLYRASVFIADPSPGAVVADQPFDSKRLPPSATGHALRVLFVPLSANSSGERAAAQQATIHLPSVGRSTRCLFTFATHGIVREFRARVVVAFGSRVIQTLVLSGTIDAAPGAARLRIEVENAVARSFDPDDGERAFDAALIVNDDPTTGAMGLTAIADELVTFGEPVGIDKWVQRVSEVVASETTLVAAHESLDAKEMTDLLAKLANYGRALWMTLPPEVRTRFSRAGRIQVVEARVGAYLPVEFLHEEPPPAADATMCPNAVAALCGDASHHDCAHREDTKFHCPLRFWGFNRVIERHPPQTTLHGDDYGVGLLPGGLTKLDALARALAARSSRVRPEDFDVPDGVVASLKSAVGDVATADDWTQWRAGVQSKSPTLLVLLPHSLDAPGLPDIPALEIGDTTLVFSSLTEQDVVGPQSQRPVVMLLGCSTQLPELRFLNFVSAFKACRASLVLGTLSTIRGRRAADFVRALLSALKEHQTDGKSFGDVFLETKRRLIAKGDGFALSLVAYGDVRWRL